MKYQKQFIFLFLSLCLLACKEEKLEDQSLSSTEIIAVKTYALQELNGRMSINCTGLMNTEHETRYAFKIGGVIDRIHVSEGEFFNKGELLAILQPDEIDAGYAQAKLGFEKAERDLLRIKNLFRDSVATLEQLQNTQTAYELSEKQLEAAAFNKAYSCIYAANDGFVAKKIANEGEIISGGAPVLAISESAVDSWHLNVGLSDKEWSVVEIGNVAQIVLDAYPEIILSGQVYRKSMAADMGTGSFQVEIKVDYGDIKPALGMFGKATIETNSKYNYQSIPYDALIEADGNNAFVFLPIGEGKVKKQAIEIASFDNSEVRISSGLEGIKEVVCSNSAFLNENSIITIIQE